jgi:preprotein translocase subunit SecE
VVYCGGLENRFGRKLNGGSNPSLSASLRWSEAGAGQEKCAELRPGRPENIVNDSIKILIWVVAIGALFGVLWWQGQVRGLALYIQETREELKKCSWPTWEELKGSTALVIVSIAMLGAFTVVVDFVMNLVFIKL